MRRSNALEKEADDFAVVLAEDFSVAEVGEGEDCQGDGVEDALPLWQSNGVVSAGSHIVGDLHGFVESVQCDFGLSPERLKVQSYTRQEA